MTMVFQPGKMPEGAKPFLPGNPGGRVGMRYKLQTQVIRDALASWTGDTSPESMTFGRKVWDSLSLRDRSGYVQAIIKIFPKDALQIDVTRSNLSPEQRDAAIEHLRDHLARIERRDAAEKALLIESRVEHDRVAS
jgi:hypothetical protein